MKKYIIAVIILTISSYNLYGAGVSPVAPRYIWLANVTTVPITVKGPTKSTNSLAIPVTVAPNANAAIPNAAIIKALDPEGTVNDTLDTVFISNTTGKIVKISRKYPSPRARISLRFDSAPQYSDAFAEGILVPVTSF